MNLKRTLPNGLGLMTVEGDFERLFLAASPGKERDLENSLQASTLLCAAIQIYRLNLFGKRSGCFSASSSISMSSRSDQWKPSNDPLKL